MYLNLSKYFWVHFKHEIKNIEYNMYIFVCVWVGVYSLIFLTSEIFTRKMITVNLSSKRSSIKRISRDDCR